MAAEIRLGDVVRDTFTDYTGTVIGITTWVHGCERCTVQSRDLHQGRPIDPVTFDLPQLVLLERPEVQPTPTTGGGPRPEPTRR